MCKVPVTINACEARGIQLSTTAQEREEHWQANRLVAKGVGRTEHLEHLNPKKRLQGEASATAISEALPFLEFDLHRQLMYKLKIHGKNAVFGLKLQARLLSE